MTYGGNTYGGSAYGSTGIDTVPITLSGTITLGGSGVQGAVVWAIYESDQTFIGSDTTDANGDYEIVAPRPGVALVGVDYDSGSQRYGQAKSIDLQ